MKFSAILLALPLLAVATPAKVTSPCNTAPPTCCKELLPPTSQEGAKLLGLLGIALEGVTALIGVGCSPISVIGIGSGSACSAKPVCCESNTIGGISIGCLPIST